MSLCDPVNSLRPDAAGLVSGLRRLGAGVLVLILTACNSGPRVAILAPGGTVRAGVEVEVAATPAARELGLMYRGHLEADRGMIFIFPRATPVKFWMRNTNIPLDLIFADALGRVTAIVANAQPYSVKLLGPPDATQYVLEVSAGFAARHEIQPGDHFEFHGFLPRAAD